MQQDITFNRTGNKSLEINRHNIVQDAMAGGDDGPSQSSNISVSANSDDEEQQPQQARKQSGDVRLKIGKASTKLKRDESIMVPSADPQNQQVLLAQLYSYIREREAAGAEVLGESSPENAKDLGIKELLYLIRRLEYYKSQAHIMINTKLIEQKQVQEV